MHGLQVQQCKGQDLKLVTTERERTTQRSGATFHAYVEEVQPMADV